jgi:anti-anti-sigma regulatory factor
MADSFFLLILPMRTLTIHLGSHQGVAGLSLRGDCNTAADANHLSHAVSQLLASHPSQAWVDCQHLHSLSWLGQRALLQVDGRSRADGTTLYWCGLPGTLHAQLMASGLGANLNLLPIDGFQGPRFLLPELAAPLPQQQHLSW